MNRTHQTDLIVALDFPRADKALEIVEKFSDLPVIFKVGFELFMAAGPEFVRELVHRKCRVFLDLKFHDIPNTVAKAALQASLMHVEMFTVHLSGGSAMIKAAATALAEIPALRPKMLGVSVLTSFDDVCWSQVTKAITGHASDVADSVAGLVEHATAWGVDGVVCSALELGFIREQFPNLYTIVPGIRPEGFEASDQARVMTPAEAAALGASAIVVGRPITEASDPRKMAEDILKELSLVKISA
ncbi:MAG: orotidine-5'-phosphate decarboxylase [Methylotenera sp.]|nr:orotidine-5'-phosphate decarboxylase [Oligoflexia bacterium]